ncbi:MAG: glycosyltransferase [Rhodobacteraceae bacterium]|nr:MAG: glycosyltransferase [Paracoccaceae bacterium]
MSDPRPIFDAARFAAGPDTHRLLGRILVETGAIGADALVHALDQQTRVDAPLGEILVAEGAVDAATILSAVAAQRGLQSVDLDAAPPDEDLADLAPRRIWMRHQAVPWARLGPAILVAMARPDRLESLRADLPAGFPPLIAVVAPEVQIDRALARGFRDALLVQAEERVAARFSCRDWRPVTPRGAAGIAAGLVGLATLVALSPQMALVTLCWVAILSLSCITTLKLLGLLSRLSDLLHGAPPAPGVARLPRISIMVPLFRETEIAGALVRRLRRLSYPKALLDVILVLEEKDTLTRDAIARTDLPPWMRVIEVPARGGLTTKPRALNYALDFCRGEIIGIWDAEDAPAPDQLEQVAAHFAAASPEVVCLQGMLDYYNPHANWLARCFTIEYASWFRVILPGIARLGLVVPLGGTTLFIRRDAILEMGGWDAHNVTEDADLGLRIARFGKRTEVIPTATWEEANCRPWPWIKQRSRWLKGFMMTWAVHMRDPGQLLRDLGWWRFLGVQAFFAGTLAQFLFAPVLWSFWMIPFGLSHPMSASVPSGVVMGFGALFLLTEAVNLCVALLAVSGPRHRFLMPWAFTMPLYFPLGVIAVWKALWEVFLKPFYWDKTRHGQSPAEQALDTVP